MADTAHSDRSAVQSGGITGERRVVTALFCDVVGSTALAERFDPEDWAEIIDGLVRRLSEPIHRYEGTVARLLGDAILAFFGATTAHEDDPQRAVLAALDMMEALRSYRAGINRVHGVDLNVRIGINTGPVVVADIGSPQATEHTALGDAVNVAARMEQTADPGTIRISGETYHLVAPLFEAEPLGGIEVKGKSEPIPAYRILGVRATPGRLRGIEGLNAPMIGRDREFSRLVQAVDRLAEGRGQIVCIIGEAGLGKSRLLSELRRYGEEQAGLTDRWEVMQGVPYDAARPFGLFQNYARGMFGIHFDDPGETIHDKVVSGIRARGGSDEAVALCSVAFERVIAARELDSAHQFTPEAIRQDIYDVMYPGLRESCADGPVVMVAEDLHWSDPASMELILHLLPLVEEVPVLFLALFRPERQSPAWRMKLQAETEFPHRYTEIMLSPLEAGDTDALISALLQIADLPPGLRALVLRKADGNPYFVEEIVRTLIEEQVVYRTPDGLRWRADTSLDDITIPDSLQALLTARMDRLDQETRSTLQLASVIGRSFYYRVLQAISDSAIGLDRRLAALERVEFLREAARRPELEYVFRHELARDAAYATLLNRKRRSFHERVGEAIETLFADRLEEQAHRLAQHFALAGIAAKALRYYEIAGEVAGKLNARAESAAFYDRALDSARQLDDHAAMARLEAARAAVVAA